MTALGGATIVGHCVQLETQAIVASFILCQSCDEL